MRQSQQARLQTSGEVHVESLNPKCRTLTPIHKTRNPKRQTLDLKPSRIVGNVGYRFEAGGLQGAGGLVQQTAIISMIMHLVRNKTLTAFYLGFILEGFIYVLSTFFSRFIWEGRLKIKPK